MSIAMIASSEAEQQSGINSEGVPLEGQIYFPAIDEYSPAAHMAVARSRTLRAHCHPVDQFQILYPSPGALYQRTPVDVMTVHYADAYTTYGPLVGGDPPLRLLTLRQQGPIGKVIFYMPDDRASVPYRGRRNLHATLETSDVESPLSAGEVDSRVIIEDPADGLEVRVIKSGARASIVIDPSAAKSGQYVAVIDGEVTSGGRTFGSDSVGWQTSTNDSAELIAGSQGCRLVIMRFPYPETKVTRNAV